MKLDQIFLLRPENEPYLKGQSAHPALRETRFLVWTVQLIGAFFLAIVVVVSLLVLFGLRPPEHLVALALAPLGCWIIYRSQRLWNRRQILADCGTIIVGEVLDCHIREGSSPIADDDEGGPSIHVPVKWLLLHYRFVDPVGKAVEGNASRIRLDLDDASLPAPGTSLAILYQSDDNYMVL